MREWITVEHRPAGVTVVRCTLVDGQHSVRWNLKTFRGGVPDTIRQARIEARSVMADIKREGEAA